MQLGGVTPHERWRIASFFVLMLFLRFNKLRSTARPTFSHEGDFNFTWGVYRDFDLTILVPIVTNYFETLSAPAVGATGLGDARVLLKYRFYRRDSQRGTTQASITTGPKVPTGRTDVRGTNGSFLPASLQRCR